VLTIAFIVDLYTSKPNIHFLKWAKSSFKKIDTIDLEVGEKGYFFQEEEVDQILMTGKLPPMTESLNEVKGIPSSTSIEFTCGACMYFAYVLNRKFGWPMTGTFMESPVDPEKGMPKEVGDFTDYDTEKVMFGHVWVQATPDIAVDIEGAKTTNKMKERNGWVTSSKQIILMHKKDVLYGNEH